MTGASDRLFIGIYPAGISYADRTREVDGDYMRLAFLSFATLQLGFNPRARCPADLRAMIERDAAEIQARRGEQYVVSGCGQTVLLGGK